MADKYHTAFIVAVAPDGEIKVVVKEMGLDVDHEASPSEVEMYAAQLVRLLDRFQMADILGASGPSVPDVSARVERALKRRKKT